MKKLDQDIFFSLLRAAIWVDENDQPTQERLSEVASLVPDGYDWSLLLRLFTDHALLGVVAHTIMSLPESKRPNQAQAESIYDHVAQLLRQRYNMQQVIVEVFDALEQSGCHPVLLKGEGLAFLYPSTCVRSVGDIDIYVGRAGVQRTCAVLESLAGHPIIERHNGNDYHEQIEYKGFEIEIHNKLGYLPDLRYQDAFEQFSDSLLESDNQTTVQIQGHTIQIPMATFNAIYLLAHLTNHFRYGGIGVRQFVDWLLIVKKMESIDSNKLNEGLKSMNLLQSWQILGGILCLNLGLPQNIYPLYNERKAIKSQSRLMPYIVRSGNFGRAEDWALIYQGTSGSRFKRFTIATKASLASMSRLSILFPHTAMLLLQENVKRVILHLLGIRRINMM